jgi:hypothetical protein
MTEDLKGQFEARRRLQPSTRAQKAAEKRRWTRMRNYVGDWVTSFIDMRGADEGARSCCSTHWSDGQRYSIYVATRGDSDDLMERLAATIRVWEAER